MEAVKVRVDESVAVPLFEIEVDISPANFYVDLVPWVVPALNTGTVT
jgi:hypothetical protein